jgi:hypothetical protein
MAFETIPRKFSCATFKNLQNTSHFVIQFLAHGDVVVGFIIFLTKLSTPPPTCMLHLLVTNFAKSWLDHYNFKKKKRKRKNKKALLHGMGLLAGTRGFG